LSSATTAFALLPEGALIGNERYVVLEGRVLNERWNLYHAEDILPSRQCPQCGTVTEVSQEYYCASCGADISAVPPAYLRYRVWESAEDGAFSACECLLQQGIAHVGLCLPREFFTEAPYGPPRRYLVEYEEEPVSASSVSVPQELSRVLQWGVILARAMELLHRHGIVLVETGSEGVGVKDTRACWLRLERAFRIPPERQSQAPGLFAQNVAGLAQTLLYLATGWSGQGPLPALPPAIATLLMRPASSATVFATALEQQLMEIRRPASVTPIVGYRSDVGRERSLNEDGLLVMQITSVFRSQNTPVGFFAVADGMGGHEAGDVASRLVIQSLAQRIGELLLLTATGQPFPEFKEWFQKAVQEANKAVYERRRATQTDMGTTLVAALLVGDMVTVGNVGDSRAYHLRPNGLTQITVDHSLVERLIAAGQITREEAAHHPQKNVIYRTIGDKSRVEMDIFEQRLAPGEAILLCSDGLSGMISDEQIWQIWRTSTSPQEACDRLVEAANMAGGEDNISVIIVQIAA